MYNKMDLGHEFQRNCPRPVNDVSWSFAVSAVSRVVMTDHDDKPTHYQGFSCTRVRYQTSTGEHSHLLALVLSAVASTRIMSDKQAVATRRYASSGPVTDRDSLYSDWKI